MEAPPPKQIVLVIEDEPLLLMFAVTIVEDAGFEALTASDADQAIEILLDRLDVRIVFTDIDMPGSMDGLKLATAIRDRWPPIEILITSGKAAPPAEAIPARGLFIPKPFKPNQIACLLQRLAA